MQETFEKKEDGSVVITRTETVVLEDPVQQFLYVRSILQPILTKIEKLQEQAEILGDDLYKYARIAWLRIGNVSENGKKKTLHKLDIESQIDFEPTRGDQIFLYEADGIAAGFLPKNKEEKPTETQPQ